MISPAPNNPNPSGLQPVAANGAGVQFATGPIHGMRVPARDCLPATTMQNRYRVGGIQRRWVWIGTVGPVKDGHANAGLGTEWHGQAWQQRELGAVSKRNFTRRGKARRGRALRGRARRGNTLPRAESGTIFHGQSGSGIAWPGGAWHGNNVTGDGNPGHFPKHQEAPASRGATVQGMTGSV